MVLRVPERSGLAEANTRREGFPFTVGICATGEPGTLPKLIETLEGERYPAGFLLRRIVIVASECHERTLDVLRRAESADPRISLIQERRRRGKASAINRIIAETEGDFLVLVNADALPAPGSISRLLRAMAREGDLGMASARPVLEPRGGVAARVLQLMWSTHNTCAQDLDGTEMSNHGTDELMVVRQDAMPSLPRGVVNDGAYIAGRIRTKGLKVRSLEEANVIVDVPSRPIEIIRQRRRILYGHLQVWRMVGRVPSTAETLMLISPVRGFGALVRTVSRYPRLILALPFAAVGELVSLIGAIVDTISKSDRHAVWERFDD